MLRKLTTWLHLRFQHGPHGSTMPPSRCGGRGALARQTRRAEAARFTWPGFRNEAILSPQELSDLGVAAMTRLRHLAIRADSARVHQAVTPGGRPNHHARPTRRAETARLTWPGFRNEAISSSQWTPSSGVAAMTHLRHLAIRARSARVHHAVTPGGRPNHHARQTRRVEPSTDTRPGLRNEAIVLSQQLSPSLVGTTTHMRQTRSRAVSRSPQSAPRSTHGSARGSRE
jgi:hypothetical protein